MIRLKKFSIEWWASLRPEVVGNETEKAVEDVFADMNKSQSFAWHRLADAKAGRGRIAAQPADYAYRHHPHAGYIEVKALKHEYRLPATRLTQLPVLHKWDMAGAANFVLVHHYMLGKWRIAPTVALNSGVPSWDLRDEPLFDTPREALVSTGCFDAL
jgi:hypothetical protein